MLPRNRIEYCGTAVKTPLDPESGSLNFITQNQGHCGFDQSTHYIDI